MDRPITMPNMSCYGADYTRMALNKKQKKQIEVLKGKIQKTQQLLSAAKDQPDDPAEAPRLQKMVDDMQAEIEKIKSA